MESNSKSLIYFVIFSLASYRVLIKKLSQVITANCYNVTECISIAKLKDISFMEVIMFAVMACLKKQEHVCKSWS